MSAAGERFPSTAQLIWRDKGCLWLVAIWCCVVVAIILAITTSGVDGLRYAILGLCGLVYMSYLKLEAIVAILLKRTTT